MQVESPAHASRPFSVTVAVSRSGQRGAPDASFACHDWVFGDNAGGWMNPKPQTVGSLINWLSRHPRCVIGFALFLLLGPFVAKPLHIDDPLFVWTGQWIQHHPGDFFGKEVDWSVSTMPMWKAYWNPPFLPYIFAGVATLCGWHEIVLHLACLALAIWGTLGV
jgi:hypothetical protein